MLERFARIVMALAVALVFAGETASAGGPCHQSQVEAVAAVAEMAADPACHEASHNGGKQAAPVKQSHDASLCECVALLKASFGEEPKLASAHVEPWRWRKPETVVFASLDLVPDGPPPKG